MNYDPVDWDIRNYAHKQGEESLYEMAIEAKSEELYESWLEGSNADIAEVVDTYISEEIFPDAFLEELVTAFDKNDDNKMLTLAKHLADKARTKACDWIDENVCAILEQELKDKRDAQY